MFTGFTPKTFTFLDELGMNNSKQWFEEHRSEFEKDLKKPFEALVADMASAMQLIDPKFDIEPKRCVSRIHRDVRFSADKSPYRTNLWLAFKRPSPEWKTQPAYFFEIFPDHFRYGMGFFMTPKPVAELVRTAILEREQSFMALYNDFQRQSHFRLAGDTYKRVLNPNLPEDLLAWNQHKEFWFMADGANDERLQGPELATSLSKAFTELSPWYHYFMNLCDICRDASGK